MSASVQVVFEPPSVSHTGAAARATPAASKTAASGRAALNRAAINRANAQQSTGPNTEEGKRRAALNALKHGLSARTTLLPSEDLATFERHVQQFLDEYKPATPTEDHLVHELANAAWRLKRIPLLEASLLTRSMDPAVASSPDAAIKALSALSLHGHRVSRIFEKTLDQLRKVQAERREREQQQLKDAAALSELHRHKGVPWQPAHDGFVFSKEEVERYALRQRRLSEGRLVANFTLYSPPSPFKPRLTSDELLAADTTGPAHTALPSETRL